MTRLTDSQRVLIDQARELADLKDADAIRGWAGTSDTSLAYESAFGEAQHLLRELAILALRQATST